MAYKILSLNKAIQEIAKLSPERAKALKSHISADEFRKQSRKYTDLVVEDWRETTGAKLNSKVPDSVYESARNSLVESLASSLNLIPQSEENWRDILLSAADFYEAKSVPADVFSTLTNIEPVELDLSLDEHMQQYDYLNKLLDESKLKEKRLIASKEDMLSLLRDNDWDWVLYDAYKKYKLGVDYNGTTYKLGMERDFDSNDVGSGKFSRDLFKEMNDDDVNNLVDLMESVIGYSGEKTVTDLVRSQAEDFMKKYIVRHANSSQKILSTKEQLKLLKSKPLI